MALLLALAAVAAMVSAQPPHAPSARARRDPARERGAGMPPRLDLGRLPGLAHKYPVPESLASFAGELTRRGRAGRPASPQRDLTDRELAALHVPLRDSLRAHAHYEGVGYVAANYSAELMPGVVHLDEFVALFRAYNVSWSCDVPEDFQPGGVFDMTLRFRRLPGAPPAPAAALVLRYLTARLAQNSTLLAWGDELNGLHDDVRPLWQPSCDAALENRTDAPFLAVVNHTLRVAAAPPGGGGFALTMLVGAAPPLAFFARLQGLNLQLESLENGALERHPGDPVVLANGSETDLATYVRAECGGNASECASPAGVERLRRRLQVSETISGTTRGNQVFRTDNLAGYSWNYNPETRGAAVSPLGLISGVPASQFGCVGCYVYMSLDVKASLDFCNPSYFGATSTCFMDIPSGRGINVPVYLREVGESAYPPPPPKPPPPSTINAT